MENLAGKWFCFPLKKKASTKKALEELLYHNVEEISLIQNENEKNAYFYGRALSQNLPSSWNFLENHTPISFEVNWKEQWELFCPYFQGDYCKIPLNIFDKKSKETLLLNAGPGFGDLSHPTTHLMMQLVAKFASNSVLIDLGCGSGILGLTALKLGAKKVYFLDIEEDALKHTKENAFLNHIEDGLFLGKTLPKVDSQPNILCMNMTFEEQKQAVLALPKIQGMVWLTSGILKEQKKAYLDFVKSLGLNMQKSYIEGKWLSFILTEEKANKIPPSKRRTATLPKPKR